MTLNPQIITKKGKKEYVVLAYKEFIRIQDALDDFEDLKALRIAKAKEKDKPTVPYEKVKEELGL